MKKILFICVFMFGISFQWSDGKLFITTNLPQAKAFGCEHGNNTNHCNSCGFSPCIGWPMCAGNNVNAGYVTSSAQSILQGGQITLTHHPPNGVTVTTREWFQSLNGGVWTTIGQTTVSHRTITISEAGMYKFRVRVNNQQSFSLESDVVLVVNPGNSSVSTQFVILGGQVTLTNQNFVAVIHHQWQQNINNEGWKDISGATGAQRTITPSIAGTYRFRARANYHPFFSEASETVTVAAPCPGHITSPAPAFSIGDSPCFTHSGVAVTSRQWQISTDGGNTWIDIDGEDEDSFCIGSLTNAGTFLLQVVTDWGESERMTIKVGRRIDFAYDLSGNRTSRTIYVPSSKAPAKAAPTDTNSFPERIFAQLGTSLPVQEELPEKPFIDRLNESNVYIFPNPTRGALAIEIQNRNPQIPHHITIHTINGRTIFQRSNIGDRTEIDLTSQPSGIYMMRIVAGDSFVVWRIIKE